MEQLSEIIKMGKEKRGVIKIFCQFMEEAVCRVKNVEQF